MSVFFDNVFSRDNNATRTARLLTIQQNLASIQSELNAPAHIVTWAATCYDAYINLTAQAGLEANQVEGATAVLLEKEALLDDEYQNVKFIASTIYKDLPDYLKDYGFDLPYPIKRHDKEKRIEEVLKAYQLHDSNSVTPILPEALMDRLQDAFDDFKDAAGVQFLEQSEARHAYTQAQNRYVSDTKMLNELKGWWYAMLGKKDGRIVLIGMVNPDYSGSGSTPTPTPTLPAPSYISYNSDTYYFTWGAVPNAESYEFQYREESNPTWLSLNAGIATNFLHADPPGDYIARVRGIAGTTMGEWSSELSYSPGSGGN